MSEVDSLVFSQSSLAHLRQLQEHPHAPKYNFQSSDLLNRATLADVNSFAAETIGRPFWLQGQLPPWMDNFLTDVYSKVPYYREFGDAPREFVSIPTLHRQELCAQIERFVPNDVDPSDLTVYFTSGTSGDKLVVPTEPSVSSKVLVLLERLLSSLGASLPRGPGRVAVAALFCQQETLTYPTLSHYLNGASCVKLNLHPSQWQNTADIGQYLSFLNPAVVTGCPFSLATLTKAAPELRPLAIFSSAVALSEGLRNQLTEVFECPVVDVYSLTECKFVAANSGQGFALISPDIYVEILDSDGRVLPSGERGEIVVTSGRNRFLPLLRYRTGDYGSLGFRGGQPYLNDLQGRNPVNLLDAHGEPISSLDVVHALQPFPIVGFSFRQRNDRSFLLSFCGECRGEELVKSIEEKTGLHGEWEQHAEWDAKPQQFVTDS